jgi:hypothetical protein
MYCLFRHTGFIRGILRGVRYAKSLRVLFLHRRSPSWTTLVLYSRVVFIFNEPTNSLCDWWGGMLNCAVDHILQKFYTLFLARFRTYKIATPPKQMTSKDDIKGLVSLSSFVHGFKCLFLGAFLKRSFDKAHINPRDH